MEFFSFSLTDESKLLVFFKLIDCVVVKGVAMVFGEIPFVDATVTLILVTCFMFDI